MTVRELIEKLEELHNDSATVIIETRDSIEDVDCCVLEPLIHEDDTADVVCCIYGDHCH